MPRINKETAKTCLSHNCEKGDFMKLNNQKMEEAKKLQDKLVAKYCERCEGIGAAIQNIPSNGLAGWFYTKVRTELKELQESYYLAYKRFNDFEIIELEHKGYSVWYDRQEIDSKGHFIRCKKMYKEVIDKFIFRNGREKKLDEFRDEINTLITTLEEAFEE